MILRSTPQEIPQPTSTAIQKTTSSSSSSNDWSSFPPFFPLQTLQTVYQPPIISVHPILLAVKSKKREVVP